MAGLSTNSVQRVIHGRDARLADRGRERFCERYRRDPRCR
jgi:hypothetical protein